VADADASTLRTELSNLLAQLPRESADLLLMDPKLNQATDGLSGQLSPLAQQQQWLSSESLATPLAACSESQLAQLQAWLNKPSGTSLDGLAIADVLRARQQHYQATLPPEQASVASMIELSLALAWSQRQR
jgi:hypothetical protein